MNGSHRPTKQEEIQDDQYQFPYHWLPSLVADTPRVGRSLDWGLEYLTYIHRVGEIIAELAPQTLLDVGCGDGRLSDVLDLYWRGHYLGIDISERAIALARALNPHAEFLCASHKTLASPYDGVVLLEVLEHIPEHMAQAFLQDMQQLVAAGGHLIVTVPTVNVPLNKKHYRHFSEEMLVDLLRAAGFGIQRIEWVYRRGHASRLLGRLVTNRFYTLNFPPILRLVWKVHKKTSSRASERSGSHLLVIASRV